MNIKHRNPQKVGKRVEFDCPAHTVGPDEALRIEAAGGVVPRCRLTVDAKLVKGDELQMTGADFVRSHDEMVSG